MEEKVVNLILSRLDSIDCNLGILKDDVSKLYKVTNGLKDDVSKLYKVTNSLKDDVSKLYRVTNGLKDDVSKLYKVTNGLKDDVSKLYKITNGLKDDVSKLYKVTNGLRDDVDTIYELQKYDNQLLLKQDKTCISHTDQLNEIIGLLRKNTIDHLEFENRLTKLESSVN